MFRCRLVVMASVLSRDSSVSRSWIWLIRLVRSAGLTPAIRAWAGKLAEIAQQSDRGAILAAALVEGLRAENVIVPPFEVLERVCSEALTSHSTDAPPVNCLVGC